MYKTCTKFKVQISTKILGICKLLTKQTVRQTGHLVLLDPCYNNNFYFSFKKRILRWTHYKTCTTLF